MTKFFTFLSLTLLTCFQLAQADVTVTFNVNMSYTIVNGSGVYVAGGGIGNPGDNELTDLDGDGIYSGSIVVADNFFSHYTILNGNCGDYGCKENIAGQTCSDPNNFNDRSFQAGTTDMTINTAFGVCSDTTNPPTVDMTFNVNLTNEIISPDGVYLAGGITFGQPGDIPMLDTDNDDIYSVTLTLPTGLRDYYTFTNGNCPGDFSCKEQLGGQACASPEFFNDRLLIVPSTDQTIDVCFGFCTEDGSCAAVVTYPITFQVDMTSQTVNPTGVFMGSSIDGWSGNIALTDADADGIYSVTLDLLEGVYEYKFINGAGWVDGGEFVPIDCDITGGSNQNRGVTVFNQAIVLDPVCFGACTVECPQLVDVTFQVDMANQDTNPGGVYLGANFDSWSGGIALTDTDGDDVWEYTATLPAGNYEYKFINGPGWVDGGEFVPDACNVVLGSGFANRGITIDTDSPSSIVLDPVCFAACMDCDSFVDVTFRVNMALENVNPAGVYMGSNIDGWSGNIALTQLGVSDIWTVTMNLAPGNYEYKFINGPGWCCPESVPTACDVTVNIPGGPFQNRGVSVIAGVPTMLLPNICFSSCDACPRIGCTDSDAHNYHPRAEFEPLSERTFYWDDVAFVDAATSSAYCNTPTTHFAGDPPSEIYLTVKNVDASTMEVIIESADADPVDLLLVLGGSGATISDEDASVAGQIKRTLTWATPPADVTLNLLWSKLSFGGNWQLSQGDIMVPFAAGCTPATIETGDFPITFDDSAVNYDLVDFGGNISGIVPDPTDPTNMVVETTKAPLAQVWAGTTAGGGGLSSPIPFTATNTKISVRVWSPEAGLNVLLKVENATNGGIFAESFVNTTAAEDWETMVFNFNVDLNNTYDKVSIFFDFGTAYPQSLCETCDDGYMNGDEEGVDCGGTNPNCPSCDLGCTDVNAHNYNDSATINDGSCETCDDGIMNGDEVATDCGGALCLPCVMGCTDNGAHNYDALADLDDGSCETCGDGLMNGDELGYDCGGALCDACMSISVHSVLNLPASGFGFGAIDVTIVGGDTSCGALTYSWTGPADANGVFYSANTEDIANITTTGAYILEVTDCLGNAATVTVNIVTRTRGRGRKASIISDALFQASPNPFSQQTILSFNLAVEGEVSLEVYDISGKKVAVLFDGTVEAEKNYSFQFGNGLPAGTYVAALIAASGDVKHIKLVVTH